MYSLVILSKRWIGHIQAFRHNLKEVEFAMFCTRPSMENIRLHLQKLSNRRIQIQIPKIMQLHDRAAARRSLKAG